MLGIFMLPQGILRLDHDITVITFISWMICHMQGLNMTLQISFSSKHFVTHCTRPAGVSILYHILGYFLFYCCQYI